MHTPSARAAILAFSFAVAGIVASCYGSDVVHPKEGPGTSYPCGVWGVECGGGTCCPWAHTCGYDAPGSRCTPGYCCYDGDPFQGPPGAARDASSPRGDEAHPPLRQRPSR